MKVLKLAIKSERWDLAAHAIVLTAVEQIEKERGVKESGRKEKKGWSKG